MYYSLVFIFKIETVINILITKPGKKLVFEIDYLFFRRTLSSLKITHTQAHTHTYTPQPGDQCLHFIPPHPSIYSIY